MLRKICFIITLATVATFSRVGWAERLTDGQAEDATHVVTGIVQSVFTRETNEQTQYIVEIKVDQVERPASLKPGELLSIYCFQTKVDELARQKGKIGAALGLIGENGHRAVPKEGQRIRASAKPRHGRLEGIYPDWFTVVESNNQAKNDSTAKHKLILNRPLRYGRVALSPNGKYLATVSSIDHSAGYMIEVTSLPRNQLVQKVSTQGAASGFAFSPDSSKLVYADGIGNLEYKTTIRSLNLDSHESTEIGTCIGRVGAVSFSDDGKHLATAVQYGPIYALTSNFDEQNRIKGAWTSGEVLVWDLSKFTQIFQIKCPIPGAFMVKEHQMTEEQRESLTDEEVQAIKDKVELLQQHLKVGIAKFAPTDVALRGDAGEVAYVNQAGIVHAYDLASGKKTGISLGEGKISYHEENLSTSANLMAHFSSPSAINATRLAASGAFAVSRHEGKLNVINLESKEVSCVIADRVRPPLNVSISADGKVVAAAESDRILVWALEH